MKLWIEHRVHRCLHALRNGGPQSSGQKKGRTEEEAKHSPHSWNVARRLSFSLWALSRFFCGKITWSPGNKALSVSMLMHGTRQPTSRPSNQAWPVLKHSSLWFPSVVHILQVQWWNGRRSILFPRAVMLMLGFMVLKCSKHRLRGAGWLGGWANRTVGVLSIKVIKWSVNVLGIFVGHVFLHMQG